MPDAEQGPREKLQRTRKGQAEVKFGRIWKGGVVECCHSGVKAHLAERPGVHSTREARIPSWRTGVNDRS